MNVRRGFKPCPNFLWDIEGLNSKDRDVILYLFSHAKNFVPSLRQIAVKCGFGEKNSVHVKKVLGRIREILSEQPEEIEEIGDFLEIRETVCKICEKLLEKAPLKIKAPCQEDPLKIKDTPLKIKGGSPLKLRHSPLKIKVQVHQKKINKGYQLEDKEVKKKKLTPEEAVALATQVASEKKELLLDYVIRQGVKEENALGVLKLHWEEFVSWLSENPNKNSDFFRALLGFIRRDFSGYNRRTFLKTPVGSRAKEMLKKRREAQNYANAH